MHNMLKEIFSTGEVCISEGRSYPIHSGITLQTGRFLQDIIASMQLKATLEIGLAYGISTLFICDAVKDLRTERHIVIDPNQNHPGNWGDCWHGIGLEVIHRAGFDHLVEFIEGTSYSVLPRLEEAGTRVDFAFVDGWHTFDYCITDFLLIDRILNVGGILVLNDSHWPGIRKACRYILTNRSYSVYRCLTTPHEQNNVRRQSSMVINDVPRHLRRLLKPETRETDENLGILPRSRCIALCKGAEDLRPWDFHEEF
jgi:predicted O-methyltransferase YrrM